MGLLLDAAFYQMLRTSLLFFCVILRFIFLKKVFFWKFYLKNYICFSQPPKWYECVGVSMVILGIIIKASKTPVESSRICIDEAIFKLFRMSLMQCNAMKNPSPIQVSLSQKAIPHLSLPQMTIQIVGLNHWEYFSQSLDRSACYLNSMHKIKMLLVLVFLWLCLHLQRKVHCQIWSSSLESCWIRG